MLPPKYIIVEEKQSEKYQPVGSWHMKTRPPVTHVVYRLGKDGKKTLAMSGEHTTYQDAVTFIESRHRCRDDYGRDYIACGILEKERVL